MTQSTPHPPNLTHPVSSSLITIKPAASLEEVLLYASEYINGAAATAYEVADNHSPEFRPLARSVIHQLDVARALIETSLDRLAKAAPAKIDS